MSTSGESKVARGKRSHAGQKAADKRAKAQREKTGSGLNAAASRAESAEFMLRTWSPASLDSVERELRHFQRFLNEMSEDLSDSGAPRRLYQDWAGDRDSNTILCKDIPAPKLTLKILYAYLDWRVGGSTSLIASNQSGMATISTSEGFLQTLWSGYHRKTLVSSDWALRTSAIAYINGPLMKRLDLQKSTRRRRTPDGDVLLELIKGLYNTNIMTGKVIERVYTNITINLQASSGSRIGALIRSQHSAFQGSEFDLRGLCWQDLTIRLARDVKSPYNVVGVDFVLRFTKTDVGKNMVYRLRESTSPGLNGAMQILTLAVAEGVIWNDLSLKQLLSPVILGDRDFLTVALKSDKLHLPVLRSMAKQPTVQGDKPGRMTALLDYAEDGRIWSGSRYNKIIRASCTAGGYPVHFASHDLRSAAVQAAMGVAGDRLHLIQHGIGHSTLTEKWTTYMRGENQLRFHEFIFKAPNVATAMDSVSKMTMERVEGLPSYLKPQSIQRIVSDPEMCRLQQSQDDVKESLQRRYKSFELAPEDDQEEYWELEREARALYMRLYRQLLHDECQDYYERHSTTLAFSDSGDITRSIDALDVDTQVDGLPPATLTGGSISGGLAGVLSVDFSSPIEVISALGDPEVVIENLRRRQADGLSASSTPSTFCPETRGTPDEDTNTSSQALTVSTNVTEATGDVAGQSEPLPLRCINEPQTATVVPPVATQPGDKVVISSTGARSSFAGPPRIRRNARGKMLADIAVPAEQETSSVSSALSPLPDAISAVDNLPGFVGLTGAQKLDLLQKHILDPSVDKLWLHELILALPATVDRATGWWPGMAMITDTNGEEICPRCQITLADLVSSKNHDAKSPSFKLNLMRTHIFVCSRQHVQETSMPEVISLFDQHQPCPICPKANEPPPAVNVNPEEREEDDQESEDDEEEHDERLFGSSPAAWTRHMQTVHKDVAETACSCGYTFDESPSNQKTHLAVKHRVWITNRLYRKGLSDAPLQPKHFPDPQFSLTDNAWHVDPVEWEEHCHGIYESRVLAPSVNSGYSARIDLKLRAKAEITAYDQAVQDLNAIVPAPVQQVIDHRWYPIVAIKAIKLPVRYGHCVICAYDPTKPFCDRMTYFPSETTARRHFIKHMVAYWVKWNLDAQADDEDEDEDEDEGEASSATVEPSPPPRFNCPDPECTFHHVQLDLWRFSNHLILHHSVCHDSKTGLLIATSADSHTANIADMAWPARSEDPTMMKTGIFDFRRETAKKKRKSSQSNDDSMSTDDEDIENTEAASASDTSRKRARV